MQRDRGHRFPFITMIIRRLPIILVLLALLSPAGAPAATDNANKYAIIVGINNYESQEIPPLYCAVSDARAMCDFLVKKMGFDEERIFLLTSDGKSQKSRPNRGNIAGAMGKVVQAIKPGGTFLFFFSGHGMNKEGESFLLTQEANPENKFSLGETALMVSRVRGYIEEMKADRVLVMIDACRTEIGGKKGSQKNSMSPEFAKSLLIRAAGADKDSAGQVRASATIFSCSNGESSYEWSEKDNGFFTYYLLRGLGGEAVDGSGRVTLNSLESYLSGKVRTAVKVQRGESQTPWMERSGVNPGAWALVSEGPAAATAASKPAATIHETSSVPKKNVTIVGPPTGEKQSVAVVVTTTPAKQQLAKTGDTARNRQDLDALLAKADALIDGNDNDKAIEECTGAIAKNPGSPELYSKRARAYYNKGDDENCSKDIAKAFSLGSNLAESYNLSGNLKVVWKKDTQGALNDYDKAIKLNPDYFTAYCNRGNAYYNKRDYDKAIEDFSKAITLKPDYALAYYSRATVFNMKKEYDRAIEDYSKAISLKPDDALAYYSRGHVFDFKREYDKAIEDYSKAISLKPDYALAYYSRGYVFDFKREYDKAIEDFSKAISLKPDDALAYHNRGTVFFIKEEYDKAIEDFSKAISLKPDYALAYHNRGNVFYIKKEYDKAIEDHTMCIRYAPDGTDAYFYLGRDYYTLNQFPKARTYLTKYIDSAPASDKAIIEDAKGMLRKIDAK
jgi:tetratricopeptide (TPR) repeat protein/uncharacterized caspase-like protein